MKKSITYLPKAKQGELFFLLKEIRKRLPEAEMVILYGSYARDEYVTYDERVEFGIPTTFMSDYDILVVTSGISDKKVGHTLDNIDDLYYKYPGTQTPVQFINEDIKTLNKQLEEGRYFYTEIKAQGVVLYDSGKVKLARRRKLNYTEIKHQAEEYFNEKYNKANEFLIDANNSYNRGSYVQSSFHLHQACENYYYSIRLTFTLKSDKQHNLAKLSASVKSYSYDLAKVFPRHTPEEEQLFKLIKAAYVEARYNPQFVVTEEDINALIPKVELLRDIAKEICQAKIEEYGGME